MFSNVLIVILSLMLFLVVILLIRSRIELSGIRKKYGSVIDVDSERLIIQESIERLSKEQDKTQTEFISKKDKLIAEYNMAHEIYEKLKKEINLIEESLDMTEYGIYKPHFDFGSSDEYRLNLEKLKTEEKWMVGANKAIVCGTSWKVGGSLSEGIKMTKQTHKLMLRAFNGECDAALSKVRWDNAVKMEERIRKSFDTINKSGEVNQSHITTEFLDLKIKELRLTFEYQEKIKRERDEQRQIQDDMREEERARKEIERAKEDAEKEELRFQKALEKAREESQKVTGEKLDKLNEKITILELQLKASQEMKARAISRAQITKSGHVYIISNMGSFGDNVFKIGMTRRLEPMDRIRELGDASVPFPFDVHAIVYSENAPELENKMHKQFETNRINLVNNRKEFFSVKLNEIESWAQSSGVDLRLTKIAEARDYRESLAIREKGKEAVLEAVQEDIPENIDLLFSKDEEQ